ncbi:DUF4870 domain-containing protein [Myxosarcina sp. GI1(2024)]
MQADSNLDKRKLLSAGCHASIFISALVASIGIPVAIFFISEDAVVKENATEAINFHLNVWAIGIVIAVLSFITFGLLGFILGPIWLVYHWGLSIWAIIHALNNSERAFRYPFIFRVI